MPAGVERARFFARQIGAGIAILDKRREKKNEAEVLHLSVMSMVKIQSLLMI